MSDLDELLIQARDAEPGDRINLRDPIAAYGELAIEAMSDWISDHRLAAFAIRVLELIGRQQADRTSAIAALSAVDRTELSPYLIDDLDRTLAALGVSTSRSATRNQPIGSAGRPLGVPGLPGRNYWVMRTSPWERPFLWSEARAGRLRQGWGVEDEQNLEVIAATLQRGGSLSDLQLEARRALRMLTSWHDGMRFGDVVVTPNLPEYGPLSIFRVTGSYQWSPVAPLRFGERFGHVLPVELLTANVDRRGPDVSDGLRSVLGVQTRLYNITGYGGDVERLTGGDVSSDTSKSRAHSLSDER
jgi:hypothetical protein